MKQNIFAPSYAFIYCAENADEMARKITTLLNNHTRDGHPHIEVVQALNLAMARMVIDASHSGFGSIDEMKLIACQYLVETVDRCLPVELKNRTAASVAYTGQA